MDIWLLSLILLGTLYLLITEKISIDLTAIGVMVLLVVFKFLTPKEAVSGFANPAVITVAAMFVVSKGMMRTGGIEPKFVRMIHSRECSEATLILVEGIKGGRPGLKIAPPLFIYNQENDYTEEVESMFRP